MVIVVRPRLPLRRLPLKHLKQTGMRIKNYWIALKLLNKLLSAKTLDDVTPYNSVPLKDFLHQYTDDPELHSLITIFCGLLITIPIEEASTGEFMWTFQPGQRRHPVHTLKADLVKSVIHT